jgi:Tat protein secretion system quality control protein TatD with DNase activity
MILPFDAHNHIHMGPTEPFRALLAPDAPGVAVSGMALQSTHPRDYERVRRLAEELPLKARPGAVRVVPCFGVHPWWLHELTVEDWSPSSRQRPRWVVQLEEALTSTPGSIVGETGLDGFHFDPFTKQLTSPLDKQASAFQYHLELAARLRRPICIHAVRSIGLLFETLSAQKKSSHCLPPKLYFHAYGGKVGTVDQITALCGREIGRCYFGFAPVINFQSLKTAAVMRKVGLERLVLETDHEDAAQVPVSIQEGIRFLAEAFNVSEQQVIEKTTANAFELYGLN